MTRGCAKSSSTSFEAARGTRTTSPARRASSLAGDVDFVYTILGVTREGGADHDENEPSAGYQVHLAGQSHTELEDVTSDQHHAKVHNHTSAGEGGTITAPPSGAAGGDLSGTYPNPSVVDDSHAHTDATFARPLKLTSDISPTQLVANTDNWNPTGLATADVIRVNIDAARDLTGIAGGADGRVLLLINTTAFTLTLKYDVTSTASNRFFCPGAADYALLAKGAVMLIYDATATRWVVVQ